MNALFGTQYFGFIAASYGVTVLVLIAMTLWVLVTHRSRQRKLAQLEGNAPSANDDLSNSGAPR